MKIILNEKQIKAISMLEENWDMILFDSPPIAAVTDATMISKEIDA